VVVGAGCVWAEITAGTPPKVVPGTVPSCNSENLSAVWSTGPDGFFVAGERGKLYHRDKGAWGSCYPSTSGLPLYAISGFTAGALLAAVTVGDGRQTWLHSGGGPWIGGHDLPVAGTFRGVHGSSGIWTVVGDESGSGVVYQNTTADVSGQWIERFRSAPLRAISGLAGGVGDVVAVGDSGTVLVRPVRAGPLNWFAADVPGWSPQSLHLRGVWGILDASSQVRIFVVGNDGTSGSAFRLTAPYPLAEPISLFAQPIPPGTGPLHAVWGYLDPTTQQITVYAVGDGGVILKHQEQ
jgi:hypothetical protein